MKTSAKIIIALTLVALFIGVFVLWTKMNRSKIDGAQVFDNSQVLNTSTNSEDSNIEDTGISYDDTCQTTNCDLLGVTGSSPEEVGARQHVQIGDDPVLGSSEASITIIEFSDYGCPYCKEFWQQSFSYLKQNYIDKGLVKFVYKDVAVTDNHPNAGLAAEAANCANDQDAYWQYHDWLFQNQSLWNPSPTAKNLFISGADSLGLNSEVFSKCLNSGKHTAEVKADFSEAIKHGVEATPTIFINGLKYSGSLSPGEIDSLLRQ